MKTVLTIIANWFLKSVMSFIISKIEEAEEKRRLQKAIADAKESNNTSVVEHELNSRL